jgi:hypothetical protein
MKAYTRALKPGAKLFYSTRDTHVVGWNRLKYDHVEFFTRWATSLKSLGLNLERCTIDTITQPKVDNYRPVEDILDAMQENPDVNNGNIKFIFRYG